MVVFDRDFIALLRRKYDNKPRSHRPDLHFVATSPDRDAHRAWINSTVEKLPPTSRPAITDRLREDRHFITAVSELGVASVLLDAGLTPHYEAELEGLTPDWYVAPDGAAPGLIIEVWTQQPRQGESSRRRAWIALIDRIASIPIDVSLVVEPSRSGFRPPDPATAKRLCRALRRWLLGGDRAVGERIEVEGYRLRVVGASGTGLRARLAMPGGGRAFDTSKALDQINDKARKYAAAATAAECCLAVVLAAEPSEPLDLGLLRSTLDGSNAASFALPTSPMDPLMADWTTTLRNEHLPPMFRPAISAIGWIDTRDAVPSLTLFDNEIAEIAFPRFSAPGLRFESIADS